MSKVIPSSIKDLLANRRLVRGTLPSVDHIVNKLNTGTHIRLVYGETYDEFGPTIDSLKYYFFMALLQRELEEQGVEVDATVIIGDLHAVVNKLVKNKETLLIEATKRLRFVSKIAERFNLNIKPVLMSGLFHETQFSERLDTLRPVFEASSELQEIARSTVLQNRIKQEEQTGFKYTLEEVALILDFDLKIGPPREAHYDRIARSLGSAAGNEDFCGLYLTPTYPLGVNFDYFVTHPEIEECGLTPYKAGSNKLQASRIILCKTSLPSCKELIEKSFTPLKPALPNPVFDLYLTSQMARALREHGSLKIDEGLASEPSALKRVTYELVSEHIYEPLFGKEVAGNE